MLQRFGQRYAILGAALACGVLAGFAGGLRWALVSLMVVFIIMPMVVGFVALKYATLPEIAMRLRAGAYTIDGSALSIYEADDEGARGRLLQTSEVKALYRSGPWDVFVTGKGVADIVILPDSLVSPADYEALDRLMWEKEAAG